MSNVPERILVIWNAADAYGRGVPSPYESKDLRAEVREALSSQVGRLFRLVGTVATSQIVLRVNDAASERLTICNDKRSFVADYSVALEPKPFFDMHGDIVFELHRIPEDTV